MPPTLDDIPTLAPTVPTGDDLFAVYDNGASGPQGSRIRKVALNQINGLSPADVLGAPAAAPTNVTTRLTMISSGTATILPPVAGVLRDVIIMNGQAATTVSVTAVGSASIIYTSAFTGVGPTNAATILAASTARFLSDGVAWYRTH